MKDEMLSVRDVSKLFKVHEWTVYNWVKQGQIPYIRIGGTIRFQKSDIDAFIKKLLSAGAVIE